MLRNLLITQSYHDLSEAMRTRTGNGAINWCMLGTWASKTAGRFIRDEEIPRPFRDLLDRNNVFGRLAAEVDPVGLIGLVDRIVGDVSGYILAGNRVVYAELAQAFSDFLTELGDDRSPDPDRLARFVRRYRPGASEPDDAVWDSERKTLLMRDKIAEAQRAFEAGLAVYERAAHAPLAMLFGQDAGAMCAAFLTWVHARDGMRRRRARARTRRCACATSWGSRARARSSGRCSRPGAG